MNEIIQTIIEQVDGKYLKFAGCLLIKVDENTLRINKGKKNVDITYNEGSDLYNVKLHKLLPSLDVKTEEINDVFFDELRNIISSHLANIDYHVAATLRQLVINR